MIYLVFGNVKLRVDYSMIASVTSVTEAPREAVWVPELNRRVRFRRMAQYITFSSQSSKVIIAMQPVHQDKSLSPRRIVLVAVLSESDSLAQFILDQGAK